MIKISPFGKLYGKKCYKMSFPTKRNAKQKLKRGNTGRKMKSAYQCKICNLWHLSHLTQKAYIQKVGDYKLMKFLKGDLA